MKRLAALFLALSPALSASAQGFDGGPQIYMRLCADCHGADGVPNLPGMPDFSRGEGLLKSDFELVDSIRFGIRGMPGFDQQISNEDMIDVLFFLRSLQR